MRVMGIIAMVLCLSSCAGAELKDCQRACMIGSLKSYMNDSVVCKCFQQEEQDEQGN